jgi:hypothetical protein
LEQSASDFRIEIQMPVALHRVNKEGQDCLEPFAADPVRCFPEHDKSFLHGFVIDTFPDWAFHWGGSPI